MAPTIEIDQEFIDSLPTEVRLELIARLSMKPYRALNMSFEDFHDWLTEDTHAEWVDGEVIMTSPARAEHQDVGAFIDSLVRTYVTIHELGVVYAPPFLMRLATPQIRRGREPDLIFVANEHRGRLRPTYLDGPADLVMEILSPESEGRDRVEKFEEYAEAGIPEYWLIDPEEGAANFYVLSAAGRYSPAEVGPSGDYRSTVLPGFWLNVNWLRERPLPDPMWALLQIDRDAYVRHFQRLLQQLDHPE